MKRLIPISLILVSALCSALADFEGTLEMKLAMASEDGTPVGGGTINFSIGKAGSRMEVSMQSPMPLKTSRIMRTDAPDKVFEVNDNARTYSEINISKDT